MSKDKRDGLGAELEPAALYYVQDNRQIVGNCALWWREEGRGYCCELRDAGTFTGEAVARLRETDIPWPVEYVRARVVHHVRADLLARVRLP